MCFRIHFRELQNCTRGKNSKRASYLFFCFISAIYPILLYTPSNFGLFLLSFHDTSRVSGNRGDFGLLFPASKSLLSTTFPSIYTPLFRIPEKLFHSVLLSPSKILQILDFLYLEITLCMLLVTFKIRKIRNWVMKQKEESRGFSSFLSAIPFCTSTARC